MLASGPIETDPRTSSSNIVAAVRELVAEDGDARSVSVSYPGFTLELRRDG